MSCGVYLISDGFNTKIGVSAKIEERINLLQTGNALDLELFRIFEMDEDAMYKCESELHEYFADFRVRGEWFKLPSEELIKLSKCEDIYDYKGFAKRFHSHRSADEYTPAQKKARRRAKDRENEMATKRRREKSWTLAMKTQSAKRRYSEAVKNMWKNHLDRLRRQQGAITGGYEDMGL